MSGDGIAQALVLLNGILKRYKEDLSPLTLTFIDARKAFDSVSHQSAGKASKRLGVQAPFVT